jgi:hypothetical protein
MLKKKILVPLIVLFILVILIWGLPAIINSPPRTHKKVYNNRISYETVGEYLLVKVRTRLNPERYETFQYPPLGIGFRFSDDIYKSQAFHLRYGSEGYDQLSTRYTMLEDGFEYDFSRSWEVRRIEPPFTVFTTNKHFVIQVKKELFVAENPRISELELYIKGKWFYDYSDAVPKHYRGKIVQRVYERYR